MITLVFASSNIHKIREIQALMPEGIQLKGLSEIGCREEIPETADTIEGNAIQKASYIQEHFSVNCFADDTGLEVAALNGAPGVLSARYAGPQKDSSDNINKLLSELSDKKDRSARFKTVIALYLNGQQHLFTGIINGTITHKPIGKQGFGYDPVFVPDGYEKTFAELTMEEKSAISHRGKAVAKLVEFLKNIDF